LLAFLELACGCSGDDAGRLDAEHPREGDAVGEAERAAAESERTQRGDTLMREPSRPAARRPDLGYDVYSGIQQRNIQRR